MRDKGGFSVDRLRGKRMRLLQLWRNEDRRASPKKDQESRQEVLLDRRRQAGVMTLRPWEEKLVALSLGTG